MSSIDPLEGLEQRPVETQVAVLATEMRNQRIMLSEVKKELSRAKQGLWALSASIIAGTLVFIVTSSRTSHSSGAALYHLAMGVFN